MAFMSLAPILPSRLRALSFDILGDRRMWVQILAATLAINVLSLALPILTLQVYDRILPNPGSGTLPVLIGGLCVAVILEIALRLARTYAVSWNGTMFEHGMMCTAIDGVLRSELSRMGSQGTGENLNRVASISRLKDFNSGYVFITLIDLSFVFLFLGLIAYIGGVLAFVPLLILILFIASSAYYGKKLKSSLRRRDDSDDRRYDFMIGSLEGVHALKALALENNFTRRYEQYESRSTISNYFVTHNASSAFNAASICAHMMIAAVVGTGALMLLTGQLTSGALIACVLLSGRIMQPVQRGLGLWARYQDYLIAREKVEKLLSIPCAQKMEAMMTRPFAAKGNLALKNVSFGYDPVKMLFRGVSLNVSKGESVRISGKNGAGCSSLMNIMAGLYAPQGGTVMIDGLSVQSYPPEELIRHIGLISAESDIFRGTIKDNITRFGLIEMGDIADILSLLAIDKDIRVLPGGYDTFLNGVEPDAITPGLKQRIIIARTMATRPGIILFDNADRNLDRDGYRNVFSALGRMKSKTAMIIVSDDRNILELTDRHYQLTADGLIEKETLATA